jgi:prepilin-type N-terminal cleavage/methylation domain-containing protein
MKGIRSRRRMEKRTGFTLIEMVTAAAIFSMLGVMLFTMIRSGMTLWKEGEVFRNDIERGVLALETISQELRLAFTENDPLSGEAQVRFLCDFIDFDRDGDRIKETRIQRLRFVRINVEERESERLRRSGDEIMGQHYFTLFEEDPEIIAEEGTLPTGGLAEAAFMAFAPPFSEGAARDGFLKLYRGYRTPIGGEDSFFASGNLLRIRDIETQLRPMMEGLLHLEFRFWSQSTRTFDEAAQDPMRMEGGGYTWDSTRALLPGDPGFAPNTFAYGLNEASLQDTTDDIFPSRVLVTVVVEEPHERELLPRLVSPVREEALRIPVDVTRSFVGRNEAERFVKIEGEWIAYSRVEDGELVVSRRGARNTLPAAHDAGRPVHQGRSLSTVVEIATTKACWNEVGGSW